MYNLMSSTKCVFLVQVSSLVNCQQQTIYWRPHRLESGNKNFVYTDKIFSTPRFHDFLSASESYWITTHNNQKLINKSLNYKVTS